MREIKFRAWDKEANIMVYSDHRTRKLYDVYYGFEMNSKGELECNWDGEFTESHVLDGGILDNIMQYTGLKDKNRVEIYEGDILKVKMHFNEYENYEIVWDSHSASFDALNVNKSNFIIPEYWRNCEVIGNIHDNPELLEVEE